MGYPLNRYVNWARHHAAANWVQAQPAAGKGAALFSTHWVSDSIADRSPTGRPVWVVQNGSLLRGLFSYKSPLFCKPIFDLQNSPAKAPDDKEVRPLRRATKGFAFGNHSLLKKAGENFIFARQQAKPAALQRARPPPPFRGGQTPGRSPQRCTGTSPWPSGKNS